MDKAAALINERLMVFLSYKEKKDTSLNKSLTQSMGYFRLSIS